MSCLGSEVCFSALERLFARSPNLKTLRLDRAVPLGKLSTLLHRAPQLHELGTGAYSSGIWSDVYSDLSKAFLGCKELKGLSGFWDVDSSYLSAFYSVCSRLTTLNLSYATIRSPDITKAIGQCPNLQRLWLDLTLYDPNASFTRKSVTCHEEICEDINRGPVHGWKTVNASCLYRESYGDGSNSTGYMVKDVIQYDSVSGDLDTRLENASVIFGYILTSISTIYKLCIRHKCFS